MPLFSRKDGELVPGVPATRRIMPFIMRTRNESSVYFEQDLDAAPLLAFLDRWNAAHPRRITAFHLVLRAVVETLHERPRLNRFTMGGHLYQRRGIHVSYSAKKRLDDDAPIVAIKREFTAEEPFERTVAKVHGDVDEGRSDKPSHVDKELGLFLALPAPVLRFGVKLLRWLDDWNLLPHAFTAPDPMYASVFIANLGSVKLDAAYHHNYEYGNIPLFVTVGRLARVPVVQPDGTVGVGDRLTLKWTLDERIEDGLYCAQSLERLRRKLEAPAEWLAGSLETPGK